jgi:hypothetical protein
MYLDTSRLSSGLFTLILGRRFLIDSSGATHFSGQTMRTLTSSTITSQINLLHGVHLRLTAASALRANIRALRGDLTIVMNQEGSRCADESSYSCGAICSGDPTDVHVALVYGFQARNRGRYGQRNVRSSEKDPSVTFQGNISVRSILVASHHYTSIDKRFALYFINTLPLSTLYPETLDLTWSPCSTASSHLRP